MSNMAEDMEWENEAPQLAKLTKSNPFTVPSNYFEELTERINQSVFINHVVRKDHAGFTTPTDYFNTLGDKIIAQSNLESYKDNENQGFTTPTDYFEELQENVTKKTLAKKVIKLWDHPFFKYAIAACLVIVSTSTWFGHQQIQNNQLNKIEFVQDQVLYDIDESVITDYIMENQQANTSSATTVEMENYILDNFSTSELSNSL